MRQGLFTYIINWRNSAYIMIILDIVNEKNPKYKVEKNQLFNYFHAKY